MELSAAASSPAPVSETVLEAYTTRVRMESGEARSTGGTLGTFALAVVGWPLKAQKLLRH